LDNSGKGGFGMAVHEFAQQGNVILIGHLPDYLHPTPKLDIYFLLYGAFPLAFWHGHPGIKAGSPQKMAVSGLFHRFCPWCKPVRSFEANLKM
jgi:hypothetical protein